MGQQERADVADWMQIIDIIAKKRDGGEISPAEFEFLIGRYVAGEIPDYQMAAFLMATYIRGMSKGEMANLTRAMALSGDILNLSP